MKLKTFRNFSLRAAATLLAVMFTATTARALQSGDWTYETLLENTCQITGYTGDKDVTSITIPSSLSNYRVTSFAGSFHFSDFPNLTTIEFPSTCHLTTMPSVQNCSKLTNIKDGSYDNFIPTSITTIPDNCFKGTAITTLDMTYVTSIGQNAFEGCPLANVKISRSNINTVISDGAFKNISTTCTIEYYGSIDDWTWKKYAYSPNLMVKGYTDSSVWYRGWCGGNDESSHNKVEWKLGIDSKLTITCTDNVAWYDYQNSQAVTTHRWTENSISGLVHQLSVERVTSICSDAFKGCIRLTKANISASVKFIGTNAFDGCTRLTSVTIEGNPKLDAVSFPEGATVTLNLTAKGPVDGDYWTTFYNAGYNFQADANTTVYKGTISGSNLTLTEVADRIVNSSTAVILKSSAEHPVMTMVSSESTDNNSNDLQGVSTETATPANCYTLSRGNSGTGTLGFYLYSGATVAAGKAYLIVPAESRGFICLGEDGTTDIQTTDCTDFTDKADSWYDLSGRRLNGEPTQKGIYVRDGKKVVIK